MHLALPVIIHSHIYTHISYYSHIQISSYIVILHIYTYTYIHTYIHIYIHIYIYIYIYMCICVCVCVCVCVYIYIYATRGIGQRPIAYQKRAIARDRPYDVPTRDHPYPHTQSASKLSTPCTPVTCAPQCSQKPHPPPKTHEHLYSWVLTWPSPALSPTDPVPRGLPRCMRAI